MVRHVGATAGAGGAIEWPRGSFFQVLYTLRLAGEMEKLSDVKLWLLVVANPSQCFSVCGLKYFETIICLFTPAAFFLHTGTVSLSDPRGPEVVGRSLGCPYHQP